MNSSMIFHGKEYAVIMVEHENIIADKEICQNLLGLNFIHINYKCCFEVKQYRLFLTNCEVVCNHGYRAILQKIEETDNSNGYLSSNLMISNAYTGSVLLGRDVTVREGQMNGSELPCYCYKEVIELLFSQGVLVTSIDHSKAMRRIRINLNWGYRSLRKKKDVKCIKKFLMDSFAGNYEDQINL